MPRIEVEVEEMAFQFDSKSAWIANAQNWYRRAGLTSQNAICVDAIGRICLSGKDFARAEADGTYPIRVYAVQPSRQRVAPRSAMPDPAPAWRAKENAI